MTTTEKLASQIKLLREVHNYTQDHVADVLNVSTNTYSLMEKGTATYTIDRIEKLAGLYKMNVMDLLRLSDQNIFHNITNSATHNVSDAITINNGLADEERQLYKDTIARLEEQNNKLMILIDKLSDKLS